MNLEIELNNINYSVDINNPIDISIPVNFNGEQPNAYNVEQATSKPYEIGNFIGDTRLGGSCNFEEYRLVPHCNGTHTECIGHIAFKRFSVNKILKDTLVPAVLITVKAVKHELTNESYIPEYEIEDEVITKEILEKQLKNAGKDFLKSLIIRTLPNDDSKISRKYMEIPHPFFTIQAMEYISSLNISHLLVDIPSVDRTFDGGIMSAHHIFWGVELHSHEVDPKNYSLKTITEMIYVPDEVPDGEYFLNLQIAPFNTDASSSRPVLYKIKR